MASPIDGVINTFVPKEPERQLQFMYYLNTIIVLTLVGFSLSNFYSFVTSWNPSYLFGGILTSVFFLMSLMNYKQVRGAYLSMKATKDNPVAGAEAGKSAEEIYKEIKSAPDYVA